MCLVFDVSRVLSCHRSPEDPVGGYNAVTFLKGGANVTTTFILKGNLFLKLLGQFEFVTEVCERMLLREKCSFSL